ncbi:hypothetical protein BDC45DRAFT_235290 [Circinella umbellata]|nr:hypothetical protein BDC45DRAFT_235290 [Circinella umbellata]
MSFVKEFEYTDQAKCHGRYKATFDNHLPSEDKLVFKILLIGKRDFFCKQF